jgi:hypothetical protein
MALVPVSSPELDSSASPRTRTATAIGTLAPWLDDAAIAASWEIPADDLGREPCAALLSVLPVSCDQGAQADNISVMLPCIPNDVLNA